MAPTVCATISPLIPTIFSPRNPYAKALPPCGAGLSLSQLERSGGFETGIQLWRGRGDPPCSGGDERKGGIVPFFRSAAGWLQSGVHLSPKFILPDEPYCTVWRQEETETRLLRYQKESEPWPYCMWKRQGKEISMVWKPEFTDKLSAWQILDGLDLFHLLLMQGALVLHGAYIVHDGGGIVFSAPSGTGKSTQAALWEQFRGAEVVNGDRCLLRPTAAGVAVHGICYSGTSQISKNISAPLKALVLLGQSPQNHIRTVRGLEAFRFLLGQCAYRTWDKWDVANVTEILSRVLTEVPAFRLDCRPDESAVETLENLL